MKKSLLEAEPNVPVRRRPRGPSNEARLDVLPYRKRFQSSQSKKALAANSSSQDEETSDGFSIVFNNEQNYDDSRKLSGAEYRDKLNSILRNGIKEGFFKDQVYWLVKKVSTAQNEMASLKEEVKHLDAFESTIKQYDSIPSFLFTTVRDCKKELKAREEELEEQKRNWKTVACSIMSLQSRLSELCVNKDLLFRLSPPKWRDSHLNLKNDLLPEVRNKLNKVWEIYDYQPGCDEIEDLKGPISEIISHIETLTPVECYFTHPWQVWLVLRGMELENLRFKTDVENINQVTAAIYGVASEADKYFKKMDNLIGYCTERIIEEMKPIGVVVESLKKTEKKLIASYKELVCDPMVELTLVLLDCLFVEILNESSQTLRYEEMALALESYYFNLLQSTLREMDLTTLKLLLDENRKEISETLREGKSVRQRKRILTRVIDSLKVSMEPAWTRRKPGRTPRPRSMLPKRPRVAPEREESASECSEDPEDLQRPRGSVKLQSLSKESIRKSMEKKKTEKEYDFDSYLELHEMEPEIRIRPQKLIQDFGEVLQIDTDSQPQAKDESKVSFESGVESPPPWAFGRLPKGLRMEPLWSEEVAELGLEGVDPRSRRKAAEAWEALERRFERAIREAAGQDHD